MSLASDSQTTNPTWEVKAWCTAPGDFPSRSLEIVRVQAPFIKEAIFVARQQFYKGWIDPIITVSVRRMKPPVTTETF